MTTPKVQKILRRLLLDPEFQALCTKAQADQGNLKLYVAQARKQFNLSLYWETLLQHILILGNFDEKILHSGLTIDIEQDPVTGQKYYNIAVYPETTQREVIETYGRITRFYSQANQTKDIRSAKRDETDYRAFTLHEQGKSYKEIADILSSESGEGGEVFEASEIPNLIKRAKQKSLR
ncbi:MAG TPA: hypothetical protein PJ984_03265 [Candidatus Saccharibacteria bacterium]|nr:hypothetical protein [Candidatus Saccharibacteria bacterium]